MTTSADGPFAESDIFQGECGQTPLLSSMQAGTELLRVFRSTPLLTITMNDHFDVYS